MKIDPVVAASPHVALYRQKSHLLATFETHFHSVFYRKL
jgi:hypothetical protein